MSKDKTVKTVQIVPIDNGWILTCQEQKLSANVQVQPPVAPVTTQRYYDTAAEACQAASDFLEPNVVQIVTGNN